MTEQNKRFENQHLSYSRLSRFEQCPLSFKLHYIDGKRAEPNDSLLFGKAIHAVLEDLVREHVRSKQSGPLSEDRAVELWQERYATDGMSGLELFEEGMSILGDFIVKQGLVSHESILGIEREFRLPVGPFEVLGFIDRVDRLDDETVNILDYKTNRMLFSREEVDGSLQMSLYHLAAKQLWPWAKKVKLTFVMLRHGVRLVTERTEEQLEAALKYVEAMGRMTEEASEFPPRLNTNCCWCDHKQDCPAYAEALKGKREFVCEDLYDLEAVAREREEVAKLAKVLYARKSELEKVLKTHLEDRDQLDLGGVRYRMFNATKVTHPLGRTLDILGKATGKSWDELLDQVATVDNKALDALVKEVAPELGRSRVALLKAELDATADKSYSPRFWAKAKAVSA